MPDNKEVTVAPEYKTHLGINPLFLTYIATLNGYKINEISQGFRYCCITTEDDTSIIPLASLFPKATFFLVLPDHKSVCLLYTSPSPRDGLLSRMPSSA